MRIESDNRAVTTQIPGEYAVIDLQCLFSTLIRFEIELWNARDAGDRQPGVLSRPRHGRRALHHRRRHQGAGLLPD